MSLIKTGQGITDIRGSIGGVYFHRDKSGLHSCSKPRNVRRRSAAQNKQRNAFTKARTYTKDPRWVSYYIYRALNDLPFIFDAIVTGDPDPNCTGTYELTGTYNEKPYYRRADGSFFIWWLPVTLNWFISTALGEAFPAWENKTGKMLGPYEPTLEYSGNPIVKLELLPPPPDYQIPKL